MSIDFSQEEAQTTPLMTTSLLGEDEGEGSLRPKRLTEYIGQEKAKENLSVFIDAAKMRQEPLDHVLLHGPPGLGKTTLSGIIANEMGVHIRITSGPAIEKPGDLAALLTNLNENDILFVDEIHRLNRSVEEILYPAMEDFAIDIIIGKGPSANSIRLDLPRFTLIGATTRAGQLSAPLRDRFGVMLRSMRRSTASRPSWSTSNAVSAWSATPWVITPPARTWAKSRTRRRRRLAIRGVPRARRAISAAPAASMGTPKIPALRVTIWPSSSGV